jgi:hypothetical protein
MNMRATLAILPWTPHDGRNVDGVISRPKQARRPAVVGTVFARLWAG